MNKKLFSIITLGATVSCALAAGLLLETPEFLRSSGTPQTVLDGTKHGRNTLLPQADLKQCMAVARPLAEGASTTLIDNVPVAGDNISNYVTKDVNNDRYFWELKSNMYTGEYYFQIDAPYSGEMDDWLFIPFEVPEGGGQLDLSMLAISYYAEGAGHSIKVCVGTEATPEAMSRVITERTGLMSEAYNWNKAATVEGSTSVTEGGKYWLGIHGASPSEAYTLRLRNISLSLTKSASEPVTAIDNVPVSGDDINNYVINNVDNDYDTWAIKKTYEGDSYFQIDAPYDGPMNDWLFIPFEIPDGEGSLNFSMLGLSNYSSEPGHNFKVCFGKEATPEAMTAQILEETNFLTTSSNWSAAKTIEGTASVSEGGKYWLGIYATSPSEAYRLRLRNICLTWTPGGGSQVIPAGEVFSMHPSEEEFANCTVIDGNNDGCKIVYDVHEGLNGKVYDWPIHYNSLGSVKATADADEWIVTPAVKLSAADRLYTASIEALSTTTAKRESFEIVMAKANDIASLRAGEVIMSEPAVSSEEYEAYTSKFGITEPGDYYFAIHVTSPLANGWRISLRDFKINLTDDAAEIPAACTGLTLTPDPTGALTATVSFTLPQTYINGKNIPATEAIEAIIASPAETATVSGSAGETVTRTITAVEGENIITVTTRNANGEGIETKGLVLCGADYPSDPLASSTVSDDNMELHMIWEPVTVGMNGGVVPQEGLTYNIYMYYMTSETGQWVPIAQNLTEREYTFRAESESQQLYQLMVSAKNSRGESLGNVKSYAAAMLGKPHPLPLNETFPGKTQTYEGLLIDYPDETYTASWALDSPASVGATDGPEAALMCLVTEVGNEGKGYVELPKFSTIGCKHPRIKLHTFISGATPTTTVRLHSTEGRGNGVVLGTIDKNTGNGWCELIYELPERYYDKGWVVLSMDVDCQMAGQVFVLGGYEIYETVANDLAVLRPSVPAYVRLGEEMTFGATVQNCGTQAASAPELKAEVYDEEGLVMTPELTFTPATLAENEKAEYTGTLNFDRIEQAGKDYSLQISLPEADGNSSNNSVAATFRVGLSNLPVTESFELAPGEAPRSVDMVWADPYQDGYVDKMESYNHGAYDYNLGNWKNVDCDLGTTYYSEGFDIPDAGKPKAFQAINTVLSGMEGMTSPSGDSFLMAFCPQGATADDWLISPEVEGGSMVTLWITSLSSTYSETLEVLSSSTDDELDSFNNVARTVTLDAAGWRMITIMLPDDAKYFALHYASNDQFGICIDDITYAPLEAPIKITGWNIYRDGALVKENHDATMFTDVVPEADKSYRYNVAAVGTLNGKTMVFPKSETVVYEDYSSIGEVASDEWTVTVEAGSIIVDGCKGMKVEVVDMCGVKLYSVADAPQSVTAKVLPGIYIVTVDGKSRKVMVP